MKRFRLLVFGAFLLIGALGFLSWLTASTITQAKPVTAVPATAGVAGQPEAGPHVVRVGVYVLNVGKLDTSTGAFTVDFYLSFSSDNESDPGAFEFANGRATSVDRSVDEPGEKFYRIQASLVDNLNLSRYPFDRD
jgi:hypothetical protein